MDERSKFWMGERTKPPELMAERASTSKAPELSVGADGQARLHVESARADGRARLHVESARADGRMDERTDGRMDGRKIFGRKVFGRKMFRTKKNWGQGMGNGDSWGGFAPKTPRDNISKKDDFGVDGRLRNVRPKKIFGRKKRSAEKFAVRRKVLW